ncbi:MAG: transcription antitermination factor NusB [Pseudomonadota bacterium]
MSDSESETTSPRSASKSGVWARRRSRRALVQAVYQWQVSGNSVASVKQEFHESDALKKADHDFFDELLGLVTRTASSLDEHYVEHLDRTVDQLDVIERAILRLATAEFAHRQDVPFKVVIDEYVELTKTFGAQDAYKYINGVLDRVAANLRKIEVNHANKKPG